MGGHYRQVALSKLGHRQSLESLESWAGWKQIERKKDVERERTLRLF